MVNLATRGIGLTSRSALMATFGIGLGQSLLGLFPYINMIRRRKR